jgi:cytosine/adenosine deaminase-related metal-dependent hydrolase
MPTIFRARWVVPIAQPPIAGGWVAVEDGRITAVGEGRNRPAGEFHEFAGAILPGLVNAHTHLELSHLHERIPPAPRFGDWVRAVLELRRQYPDPSDPAIVASARRGIAAAVNAGTALVGDVSNTLMTVPLLRERGLAGQVFYELTGFTELDPEARVREARARADAVSGDDVRVSLAPHAPYSVSAALFRAIRADLDAHPETVSSVHLGETPEELELLRDGSGDIRGVLEELGRWPPGWQAPGVGPVEYLADMGVLDHRMLAVHGVQFRADDLVRLRSLGTTLVSCPRSNGYVGVGSPPLDQFYSSGVAVALGTDSLASVADLNMFAELHEARRIAGSVPPRRLLESATLAGARALGFEAQFGTIEPGKRAALIGVTPPGACDDVEEYLCSGVEPEQVRWLTGSP